MPKVVQVRESDERSDKYQVSTRDRVSHLPRNGWKKTHSYVLLTARLADLSSWFDGVLVLNKASNQSYTVLWSVT